MRDQGEAAGRTRRYQPVTVPAVVRAAVLALVLPAGAQGADLAVVVQDVANNAGHVLVAVCTEPTFLGSGCPYTASAPAGPGDVTVLVRSIAPGTYAVQAFHDENDNVDIDRSMFGIPKEAMGFSNDAPMSYGPPRFADAAVAVGDAGATLRLRLRSFSARRETAR